MASSVKPGPQPGQPPPRQSNQPVTNNGRPQASIQSPGQVPTPPPIPAAGYRMAWAGMNDQGAPQPKAEFGKPGFNFVTGEWFPG